MLKAAFKDTSVFAQILVILAVVLFGTLLATVLSSLLIITKVGFSQEIIIDIQQNLLDYPDITRGLQFLQFLGVFLLPAIVCAWLFSDNYKEYLGIDHPIYKSVALWTIIGAIVSMPFLNFTYSINQQMVFPEVLKGLETWMKESELAAEQLINSILDTNYLPTIIFNFLIVCVIAAICEEFLFRGLLQKYLGRVIKNPHVLIWIIAIFFSAIHLQFYGFITRMILGAWLGYLMYYTKTIWIPVLAHFSNNLFSIGTYYLFKESPEEIEKIDAIGTGSTGWLAVVSLVLFLFCISQIKKSRL